MLTEKLINLLERSCPRIINRAEERFHHERVPFGGGELDRHKLRAWAKILLLACRRWMSGEDHDTIARDAFLFGSDCARAGASLAEVIRALHVLKHCAVDQMRALCLDQSAFEIYIEEEFEYSLGKYWDCITYHLVSGYEHEWYASTRGFPIGLQRAHEHRHV